MDPTETTGIGRVCTSTQEIHGTGAFAGLLKHIKFQSRYQDLGIAHVDPKSLFFHAWLPKDQLLLQFLQPFSDDNQVTSIQVFWGTSCKKLLGEGFRDHGEQQDFRQEPWWTPTSALNSSLRFQPTRTLLLAFSYTWLIPVKARSYWLSGVCASFPMT